MWFLRATTYDKTHFFFVKITLLTIRIALIRRMIPFLKGKQFHIDISSKYSNLECNRQFEINCLWRYKKKKEKVDFCEIVNQLLRIKIPNNECCSPLSNSKNWHEFENFNGKR